MTSWSCPSDLRAHSFILEVDADSPEVSGFGRVSIRAYESGGHRRADLRCGRATLSGELPDIDHWHQLQRLSDRARTLFADIQPTGIDRRTVTLFALRACINIDEGSIAPANELGDGNAPTVEALHDDFVREDDWSGDHLLLVRSDPTTSQMFLCADAVESPLQLADDELRVGPTTRRKASEPTTTWLIAAARDASPFSPDSRPDPSAVAQLRSHLGGIGDFLTAWQNYAEAEEADARSVRQALGEVRYGKVREKLLGESGGVISVGINPGESAGLTFLTRLAEYVAEGRKVNLQLAERLEAAESYGRESGSFRATGAPTPCVGAVTDVDTNTGEVELAVDSTDGLAGDGWISVSLAGDLRQIKRRKHVLERLQSDKAGIATLRAVLAGTGGGLTAQTRSIRRALPESVRAANLTERQMAAVRVALATPDVALIQGPPGTGKTKVITAIEEALAHLEGPSRSTQLVLLSSTQNDAVDQVAAKTRVFGLPPYRDNKGDFDPIADWRRERLFAAHRQLSSDAAHTIGSELASAYIRVRDVPVTKQELARSLERLASRSPDNDISHAARSAANDLQRRSLKASTRQKLERRIRALRVSPTSFEDDGRARLADLSRLMDDRQLPDAWKTQFATRLEQAQLDGSDAWRSSRALRDDLLDHLAAEVDDRPSQAPKEIVDLFAEAVGRARRSARSDATAVITVGEAMERFIEDIEQNPEEADAAIRAYTVVHAATCQRSGEYLGATQSRRQPELFENAIVDEAGRASPLDLLIPLVQARKRVILVGDHRQLPAVYDEKISRGLPQSELLEQSLFERLFQQLKAVGDRTGVRRTITLDQQFRMHPRLGEFVSRVFYEPYGEAINSGLPSEEFNHEFPGFEGRTAAWVDVPREAGPPRRHQGRSWSRDAEADGVAAITREFVTQCPTMSVGVISFYRGQSDLIMERLLGDLTQVDARGNFSIHPDFRDFRDDDGTIKERLRIGSVDAFQGKEFDAVILSMVRSGSPSASRNPRDVFGFLTVENRFCVALSRQKRLLVVVGDRSMADLPQAASIRGLRELRDLCDEEEVTDD